MSASPLAGLTTGTIVGCLQELGYPGCFMTGVGPVTPTTGFVGRARTLRCLPPRADLVAEQRADRARSGHRVAIDEISPGEVLVVDARGVRDAAVAGDLLLARVKAAGGVGLVTDGCVRDKPGVLKLDFPVYASGFHAASFGNRHIGIDVNLPIACGGVLVRPGDLLVGDVEGVVVVPAALEQRVAELAVERDELDTFIMTKIEQGRPAAQVYPPDAETRAEFERYRASRRAAER
jgi:5-oxopent-3-ene-1,2,5-tricarboxylate decarboxylase / 2-hydroxyhepta-2,4-diene-1,7-dioate isomerase